MLLNVVAFVAGMIVMDFMWAWRLGMPQALWSRFRNRDSN